MEMTINTHDLNATRTMAAESLEGQNPSTASRGAMDELFEGPALGAETEESISIKKYQVHERYWPLLQPMQIVSFDIVRAGPPRPKEPVRLCNILRC
jgi:hypothetical protein